jgi:hypothetical protein
MTVEPGLKYTVSGDAELDSLIDTQLLGIVEAVRAAVPQREIVALVLGGGYGRGEGGARKTASGFRPYNDYDLVLVHRCQNGAVLSRALNDLHRTQSSRCGVHVDVMPLHVDRLSALPQTLTWYELVRGHKVLYGDAQVLAAMGERQLEDVLLSEWGRLLFNRGSGVLFGIWLHQGKGRALIGEESKSSFVTRQVQKAWLALGDVFLAERGLYEVSVQVRRENMVRIGAEAPEYAAEYLEAVDFKLSPGKEKGAPELASALRRLAIRYGCELARHPASERKPLVGLYGTLRDVSARRWLLSRPWRYPRERMRYALIAELRGDVRPRRRSIGTPEDYVHLWRRYA